MTYGDNYSFKLDNSVVVDAYGQVCENKISKKINVPDADSFANYKDLYSNFTILESQFEPKRAFELQNADTEYSLTAISGVTEKYSAGKTEKFKIKSKEKNVRYIETIDLKNFLEKTGNSWKGGVKFSYPINQPTLFVLHQFH